jgi:diguanylate cyclase (GGDEF)-like protein
MKRKKRAGTGFVEGLGAAMKSGMRILLVDDEKDIREAISHILCEKGYEVKESESGMDALALFKADFSPLIISDIIMNGMSGIELLAKVKQIQPATEVILITGYASVETATAALRHGAFDYIMKSYDNLSVLPEVVERAGEKIHRAEEQRMMLESLKKMNATLERAQSNFKNAAAFDELTGLYNGRHFQEVLEGEVSRSVYFKRKFSLVIFTVDHSAWKNAPPERMEMTQLFCDVTRAIKQRLRKSDVFARYEENMFAIILPETAREGAQCVVNNINQLMASGSVPSLKNGPSGDIEVLAETAVFPEDGVDGAALVRHAFEALKAKKG